VKTYFNTNIRCLENQGRSSFISDISPLEVGRAIENKNNVSPCEIWLLLACTSYPSKLKMEAVRSFGKSTSFYKTKRLYFSLFFIVSTFFTFSGKIRQVSECNKTSFCASILYKLFLKQMSLLSQNGSHMKDEFYSVV
jgi:hypothetical protein